MRNKKSFFITFEGIEGSGKSYQCKKLYKSLKKNKLDVLITREPGGSLGAEKIRKIILTGAIKKFSRRTDTLLYLASRNEHFENKIKPSIMNKKIILCDRFVDSTIAYQVYGSGESKSLVDNIHKHILGSYGPDMTFVLKVNINKAFKRIAKRKIQNRYDKFTKNFYTRVQKSFIKIAKKNKSKYIVLDNSKDNDVVEKIILKYFYKRFNKK